MCILHHEYESYFQEDIWILTYFEPCNQDFARQKPAETVSSCTSKITDFCAKENGRVNVVYSEVYHQNKKITEEERQRVWAPCKSFRQMAMKPLTKILDQAHQSSDSSGTSTGAEAAVCEATGTSRRKRNAKQDQVCKFITSKSKSKKLQKDIGKGSLHFIGKNIMFKRKRLVYRWSYRKRKYVSVSKNGTISRLLKMAFRDNFTSHQNHISYKPKVNKKRNSLSPNVDSIETEDSKEIHHENYNSGVQFADQSFNDEARFKFPNIDFIFSGYAINHANPFSTRGLDPGFRMGRIFNPVYKGDKTADGKFHLPIGIYGRNDIACQRQATSKRFKSSSAYKRHISAHIGVDISSAVVSGGIEAEVEHKVKLLKESDNSIVNCEKRCQLYRIEINTINPPTLSSSFLDAIEEMLHYNWSFASVKQFTEQFGTHFIKSANMGYRTGVEALVKSSSSQKSEEAAASVQMALESFMFSAKAGMENRMQQSTSQMSNLQEKYIYSVGREIVDETYNGEIMTGSSPLDYRIEYLYNLPGLPESIQQSLKSKYNSQLNVNQPTMWYI